MGEVGCLQKESIDPSTTLEKEFIEYSMPAFDKNQEPVLAQGSSMQSNRLLLTGRVLLVNKLNVRKKRIWLIEKAADNAVCTTEFLPFSSTEKDSLLFLKSMLGSDKTTKDFEAMSSGTSNSQQRITPSDFLNFSLRIPIKVSEQAQIGTFFQQLDTLITLHQRKPYIAERRRK